MIDRQRRNFLHDMRESAQRHLPASRGLDDKCDPGRSGVCMKFGLNFQHDMILIELGEHRRDLPLAESVVQRVVDRLRRDAEARKRCRDR